MAKAKELPALQSFKHLFERPELWSLTRYSVAKAVSIGVFAAFIPLPAQMLIAGSLAIFFRANLLISVTMVWLTNPLTLPPIFYFCYRVGLFVLDIPKLKDVMHDWSFMGLIQGVEYIWQPLFLGLAIVGITCTILSYYSVLLFWRVSVSLRWISRKRRK